MYSATGHYAESDPQVLFDPETAFSCWIAVTPCTADNGTLFVLPRQHDRGLLPHHLDEERREWVADYDVSGAVPVELAAGQMAVFRKTTPHGSFPNRTDGTRIAYQISYGVPGMEAQEGTIPGVPLLRGGQLVEADDAP